MKKRTSGNAEIQLMPKNRTIIRSKGCWNCIHWDNDEMAKKLWSTERLSALSTALEMSKLHIEGENHPRIVGMRRMIDGLDNAISRGIQGVCLKGVSDSTFVADGYLCNKWDGRQGSSLAQGDGASDTLPEELKDKIDGN